MFMLFLKSAAKKKAKAALNEELGEGERSADAYRHGCCWRCIRWIFRCTFGRCAACQEGTYQHDILINVFGFISGLFMTTFFFCLFILKLDYDVYYACGLAVLLGAFLSFGLAFSSPVRCMVLLMIPQLFSSTGRIVLLAYAMLLVMSGPMANINNNLNIASKSQACGSALAYNQSQEIFNMATAPLSVVIDSVEEVVESMKEIVREVKTSFEGIADALDAVGDSIQTSIDWLNGIVDKCNEKMGAPETLCREKFQDAEKKCKRIPVINIACGVISLVENVCAVAGIGKLFCLIPGAIVGLIVSTITTGCTMVLDELEKEFYVNVDISHNFSYDANTSKTVSQITEGISREIEKRTRIFSTILMWASRGLALTILWIFLKAWIYRRKYLAKDRFDNCYITSLFVEMDDKRMAMDKETILPLRRMERGKFIRPFSLRLARMERFSMITGLVLWFAQGLWTALIMSADYGAHWLLHMIAVHATVKTQAQSTHDVRMRVDGEGLLADLYRVVISGFDPMTGRNFSVDTTKCLPMARPPDIPLYSTIGTIYGIALFLVLTEAYGLRLRRVVAAYYYPQRERERIAWLYTHILKRRGGFLRFLRKAIRKNSKNSHPTEKVSMIDFCAAMFPMVEKILKMCGIEKKYCLGCGQSGDKDDTENFKHCVNHGCKGIYCIMCFADLNNMCTLCMKPVDYGDYSDLSEERDSSDEEPLLVIDKDKDKAAGSADDSASDYEYSDTDDDEYDDDDDDD
ncbi:DC-STAMP domain-containing protein 2-like [Saccoglossus kowalevskii]|uniref:DC-STAMP domain-containing protein 2-like n=1 Tax=Saccoglossus kowalevskii TaxID=10224 RepID=A0ABM0M4M3_SACKO|nr:PREDICTED: DC-STAMP domain-containing protein 2-like [Saccoglossus kowalevskii]